MNVVTNALGGCFSRSQIWALGEGTRRQKKITLMEYRHTFRWYQSKLFQKLLFCWEWHSHEGPSRSVIALGIWSSIPSQFEKLQSKLDKLWLECKENDDNGGFKSIESKTEENVRSVNFTLQTFLGTQQQLGQHHLLPRIASIFFSRFCRGIQYAYNSWCMSSAGEKKCLLFFWLIKITSILLPIKWVPVSQQTNKNAFFTSISVGQLQQLWL